MGKYKILFLFLTLILVGCQSLSSGPKTSGPEYSETHLDFKAWGRTPGCCTAKGTHAAIASGGTHASKAGIQILKAGGNVVDAAVAVAFVLSVERPHSAGLGGGGFMTLYLKRLKDPAHFVDFRETAPRKATRDMYLDKDGKVIDNLSVEGPLSVATPGFVAGLYAVHKKWGKLPWRTLFNPAIKLAANGFMIYPSLEKHIEEMQTCLMKDPESQKLLFKDGKPLKAGELLVQKDLSETLKRIAQNGQTEFRTGKTAKKIVEYMKAHQGLITSEDLKRYEVKYRKPVQGKFKDMDLVSAPPPSAGGVLILQMLRVLNGMPLEEISQDSAKYTHLLSELMKVAYADRASFVGDPDFTQFDTAPLVSDAYTERIRKHLDLEKATASSEIKGGQFLKESNHTTHLSVMDSEGNAVASTLTINNTFGACVIAPGTGVFLNDEMDDFSAKPGVQNIYGLTGSEANAIAPLKRPASSMSPTIVLKGGKPILVAGAAGGSRITSSVLQVLLNDLVVYKNDLKKAVFAQRMHQQWVPDFLDLEGGYSEPTKDALTSMGENIRKPPFSAITQATHREANGEFMAVFDPRDEGGAGAY